MESSLILDRKQVDFTVSELARHGLVVFENFIPLSRLKTWNSFFDQKQKNLQFQASAIGKNKFKNINQTIRSDEILWLDRESEFKDFWTLCSQLQNIFNSEFFLNIKSSEFHLACYKPGQFYKKHYDRHQNSNSRQVTLTCYLNESWSSQWGGELVIYSAEDENNTLRRIYPTPGSLVLFRSEIFPHEVLSATQERRSLTGWFRDDDPSSIR